MAKRIQYRRSDTGRICSAKYADENPATTYRTTVEAKGGRPKKIKRK